MVESKTLFLFNPIWREMIQLDEQYIFQLGLFNHQLVVDGFCEVMVSVWCFIL